MPHFTIRKTHMHQCALPNGMITLEQWNELLGIIRARDPDWKSFRPGTRRQITIPAGAELFRWEGNDLILYRTTAELVGEVSTVNSIHRDCIRQMRERHINVDVNAGEGGGEQIVLRPEAWGSIAPIGPPNREQERRRQIPEVWIGEPIADDEPEIH